MARSRLLKPGFFQNEHLAELPYEGRLLFAGLWILADREGRLEDRPKRIKAALFPWDDVAIDDLLAGLAERGFITRYQSEAVAVIQITKFHEHQKPHKHEQDSTLPAQHDQGRADYGSRPAVSISISKTVSKTVKNCGEPAEPSAPCLLSFPCSGHPKTWPLSDAQVQAWQAVYDIEVEAECRKAHAWVLANMGRKKTAGGMERFLVNWLARATNDRRAGGDRRQCTSGYMPSTNAEYDRWPEECRREHGGTCGNYATHQIVMLKAEQSA